MRGGRLVELSAQLLQHKPASASLRPMSRPGVVVHVVSSQWASEASSLALGN